MRDVTVPSTVNGFNEIQSELPSGGCKDLQQSPWQRQTALSLEETSVAKLVGKNGGQSVPARCKLKDV